MIQSKGSLCIVREDQLLIYVRGKKKVRKSCIIHILEVGFTLLNRKNNFMISALTEYAAKGIGGTIMYITLIINTCKARS